VAEEALVQTAARQELAAMALSGMRLTGLAGVAVAAPQIPPSGHREQMGDHTAAGVAALDISNRRRKLGAMALKA